MQANIAMQQISTSLNRPFRFEQSNALQQTTSLFVHLISFAWLNRVLDK
jgi:hypothetical protein